jgi:phosphatidylglycerophosphate synthase
MASPLLYLAEGGFTLVSAVAMMARFGILSGDPVGAVRETGGIQPASRRLRVSLVMTMAMVFALAVSILDGDTDISNPIALLITVAGVGLLLYFTVSDIISTRTERALKKIEEAW